MTTGFANTLLWGTELEERNSGLVERRTSNSRVYRKYEFLRDQPLTEERVTEAFNRENGKVHRYDHNGRVSLKDGRLVVYHKGDLYRATLEMCINNINHGRSKFQLDARTLPTLAREANMTVDYLAALVLHTDFADTRFGEFVARTVL